MCHMWLRTQAKLAIVDKLFFLSIGPPPFWSKQEADFGQGGLRAPDVVVFASVAVGMEHNFYFSRGEQMWGGGRPYFHNIFYFVLIQ